MLHTNKSDKNQAVWVWNSHLDHGSARLDSANPKLMTVSTHKVVPYS